jgi:hypothetical protein
MKKIDLNECLQSAFLIAIKDNEVILSDSFTKEQENEIESFKNRLLSDCDNKLELMLIRLIDEFSGIELKYEDHLIKFGVFSIDDIFLNIGETPIGEIVPKNLCESERFLNFIEANNLEKFVGYEKEIEGDDWTPENPITLGGNG